MQARASRAPGLSQFFLLFERMVKLYIRDKGWLIGALVLAPVLMTGLAIPLDDVDKRHSLLFVATLLALFFGIFPSIDMIISEKTIYDRERMVNLKIPSYLLSKVMFLLAFGVFQAFSIAAVLYWFVGVDAALAPMFFLLLSVQTAGVCFGLFFSTIAKSGKVAMMAMLGFVVVMLAFSGFLVKLPDLSDGSKWVLTPSAMRWGLGGLMSVVQDVPERFSITFGFQDDLWSLNTAVNFILSVFPLVGTILVLRMRDKV
jgi:hypothetical protein